MLTIYDRMVMDYSLWLARLEIGAVVMCITVVGAIPVIISIWNQCWNFSDSTMGPMDNCYRLILIFPDFFLFFLIF